MSTSISSQSTGAGWRVWPWMLPVLAIIGLDQFTKTLATQLLSYGEAVAVNPYLNWTLLYNRGAAFSFLSDADGWQRWFFIGVSTVVSIVIVTWNNLRHPDKRYVICVLRSRDRCGCGCKGQCNKGWMCHRFPGSPYKCIPKSGAE